MNIFGPPDVNKLEKKGNVRGLIRALRYSGKSAWKVHYDAIEALMRLAPLQAVDPLIAIINDNQRDNDVRRRAMKALGELRDVRAFIPLVNCWKSHNDHCAVDAQEALEKFTYDPHFLSIFLESLEICRDMPYLAAQAITHCGDKSHIPLLISWLTNDAIRSRKQAAIALDHLGWQPTADETGAYYWAAKKEYELCAKIGAQALMPLLENFLPHYRRPIDTTTVEFKDDLFKFLTTYVIQVDRGLFGEQEITKIARLMLSLADERIAMPLLEILFDSTQELNARVISARLLAYMKDQRALEQLLSWLSSPHEPFAEDIIWAICTLKPDDHEPYLSLLKQNDLIVRRSAIKILGCLESKRAIQPLITIIDDQHSYLKYDAIISLDQIGGRDVFEYLIQRFLNHENSEDEKRALLITLKNNPDPRTFEGAYKIMCDGWIGQSTRQAAADLLIALYQNKQIDEKAMKQLTDLCGRVYGVHEDGHISSDCGHEDFINVREVAIYLPPL